MVKQINEKLNFNKGLQEVRRSMLNYLQSELYVSFVESHPKITSDEIVELFCQIKDAIYRTRQIADRRYLEGRADGK